MNGTAVPLDQWLRDKENQYFPQKQPPLPYDQGVVRVRQPVDTTKPEEEFHPSFDLDEPITFMVRSPSGQFYELTVPKHTHVVLYRRAEGADKDARVARLIGPGLEVWVRGPGYDAHQRRP